MPTRNGSGSSAQSLKSDLGGTVGGETLSQYATSITFNTLAKNFRSRDLFNENDRRASFADKFPNIKNKLNTVNDLTERESVYAIGNIRYAQDTNFGSKNVAYVGNNLGYYKSKGTMEISRTPKDAVITSVETDKDGTRWALVQSNAVYRGGVIDSTSLYAISDKGEFKSANEFNTHRKESVVRTEPVGISTLKTFKGLRDYVIFSEGEV
jgi:hypothetical protein